MNHDPVPAQIVFLAIVAAVTLLFCWAVHRANVHLDAPAKKRRRRLILTIAGTMVWLGITAWLSLGNILGQFERTPPPFFGLMAASTLVTLVLAFSPFGTRLARGISMVWLVGYQAFRIPLEWVLYDLAHAGIVPVQMTYAGLNYDILTGVTALAVAWFTFRQRLGRRAWLAWNSLGLGLLITVVTVAILSAPTPFRVFMEGPSTVFATRFPYIWLPTFLVQAALLGHLLVFRKLWMTREELDAFAPYSGSGPERLGGTST